jgi:hypothetical protein
MVRQSQTELDYNTTVKFNVKLEGLECESPVELGYSKANNFPVLWFARNCVQQIGWFFDRRS